MLPHVLRFNARVNAERQDAVADALGRPGWIPADAVADLIAALGLPGTLQEVGVRRDQLDIIAAGAMHDRCIPTNPRKINGPADLRALLDAAW
jgi:maleylacetate reductase